jgi:predicted nucleic acid-binding protein
LLWEWLPLSAALVESLSARIRHLSARVFIRASDALHLASAAEQGFKEIYSNDRRLLEAAPHFGLRGLSV